MKKLLLPGFGLLLLSGAGYMATQAAGAWDYMRYTRNCGCVNCDYTVDAKDRYQSQNCCEDMKRTVRPFSDRIGPYRYRQPSRSRLNKEALNFSHPSRRHDVWYHRQYDEAIVVDSKEKVEIQRALEPQFNTRNANRYQSDVLVVRNGDYKVTGYGRAFTEASYRPDTGYKKQVTQPIPRAELKRIIGSSPYAWDVPAGFTKNTQGVYEDARSSIAFRLTRTSSEYECLSTGFRGCAVNLGKSFRQSQKLTKVEDLEQDYRWEQTVDSDFGYYPTYVEGFVANGYGTDNVYYIFNALDPVDGSVVRIESVARDYDADHAAEIMKQVFESFRFQAL